MKTKMENHLLTITPINFSSLPLCPYFGLVEHKFALNLFAFGEDHGY